MKLLKSITKYLLLTSLVTSVSCATNNSSVSSEFGVNNSSIQTGTEDSGKFTTRDNKTFKSTDKIVLKFQATGLTIKDTKIKTNIDLFLKKDKDILGTESDILGKDGLTESISGVDSSYKGNNGSADIKISIIPPSDTKGELSANITVKDLNNSGKLVSFETKFTLN